MNIKIRKTKRDDFGEIKSLLSETNLLDSWFTKEKFEKMLKRNNGFCYIAKDSKKIVGTAFGTNDGAFYGYVYKVATDSSYRRKGIASKLVAKIVDEFKKVNIPLIFAHTQKANKASIRMLQSLGFEIRDSHYLIDIGYKTRKAH